MSSNTTFKAYAKLAKQRRGLQQGSFHSCERAQRPPEDTELSHVGLVTPCGEYFRRFWIPVIMTQELTDAVMAVMFAGDHCAGSERAPYAESELKKIKLDPHFDA